jgi:hypothetical protein
VRLPRIRFAFALIFAAADLLSFPRRTICVARAFAFAACRRSGIGYARRPGSPNVLLRSRLRLLALKRATVLTPHECAHRHRYPLVGRDMSEQTMQVDAGVLDGLLLRMEANAHRGGWDGPAMIAILSGDEFTERAYRFIGMRTYARHGNYAAWAFPTSGDVSGWPQHALFRLALNLANANDHPQVAPLLEVWRQPGFIGTAFMGEGWARKIPEGEPHPTQRFADLPGSIENRFVHAADVAGGYHAVFRNRGSKPVLVDESYTPGGSIYDSLRAITAVIAGQQPPEKITEPTMWSWDEQTAPP